MAKKAKIEDTIPEPIVVTPTPKHPMEDKIKELRAKGFDDNRIAANLMIHKHIVESI